uniref:N-acetyltransferase domain-containing protein n=1 Tax=Pseudomonas phage HRDY3 TaxID=3236930 RepID=A0AB39CE28_9VIRU
MDIDYQTFEAGDFTCLPAMSNGCAASIGYIADHIPRKDSVVVLATGIDAEGKQEVAGYILATANHDGVFIHNVHVQEIYRRNYVATGMLTHLVDMVDHGMGSRPIKLFVADNNAAGIACYLANGFHQQARIPNCREANVATLLMTL